MDVTTENPSPTPVSGWGGARPGAGRKKKPYPDLAIRSEIHRVVTNQVMPEMPKLVEALMTLAMGARVAGSGPDAGQAVYAIPPDALALACLLSLVDRVA